MSAYSIATRGLAGRKIPQATLTPMGALLFGSAEPGAWYDPGDMSTLFQDSAGTVPVTAVEQPVGRILDKSGRGNHAAQSTTTKRPVYSRRVNLLTLTEQMAPTLVVGTGWTRGAFSNWSGTVSLGAKLAPDGTMNAAGIRASGGITSSLVHRAAVMPNQPLVFRLWVRTVDGEEQSGLSNVRLLFQTGNNDVIVSSVAASVTIGTQITSEWQQFALTYTVPSTGVNQVEVGINLATTAGTASVAVWGASLTPATDSHIPYQRVNTATDYDADPDKFPAYLRFDGVDDALQTGNIDFTGTDKMTVWVGITKLSDAAVGAVVELSASQAANTGSFYLSAPFSAAPNVGFLARGTVNTFSPVSDVTWAAPASLVATGQGLIGGAIPNILRTTGKPERTIAYSIGTGNYGNHPLFIGARGGTSLFFNGRLYSLIVRGAQSSLSQIEATELYIKQKMRML